MNSIQELAKPGPQQMLFDTDLWKSLINSGASTHMSNWRKDFISYHSLSKDEQEMDKVLSMSGDIIMPQGIGTVS